MGAPMVVDMDINVVVGQELLTFSGFGLNADLAGQVHIGNNMDTRGELRLNNGRYRAYGQRRPFAGRVCCLQALSISRIWTLKRFARPTTSSPGFA